MSEPVTIKRGTEIELEIESLAYGGMGLARIENFVIFVKHAIPGQKVLARICLLYTSPSPRDNTTSRMPSSA